MYLPRCLEARTRPAFHAALRVALLALLSTGCVTSGTHPGVGPADVSPEPTAAQSAPRTALAGAQRSLRIHRAEIEAALAALDGSTQPAEVHAAAYRQHLDVLSRLEEALAAYADGTGSRARLAEAIRRTSRIAVGAYTSIELSEAAGRTPGRYVTPEVLAPFHLQAKSAAVAHAALAVLGPAQTAGEAETVESVAAALVEAPETRARAVDLACQGRALLVGTDLDRGARWALARSWWVEGKAAVADGQLDAGIERLTKATEAWGRPHTTFEWTLATALEAAGRSEEAAIRWALVEVDWGRPGEEQLKRLASAVDIEAARAAPEVVAFREKREAARAERTARRERRRQPVASLELIDARGRRTVDALRGGKPAVVVFWTSTCGACVMELPVLARLSRRLEGLAVIPVNSDEDPAEGRRFLEENGWELPFHHLDHETATFRAGVEMWPTTVLLDTDGRECHRSRGYGDASRLEALLEAHAAGHCGEPASE